MEKEKAVSTKAFEICVDSSLRVDDGEETQVRNSLIVVITSWPINSWLCPVDVSFKDIVVVLRLLGICEGDQMCINNDNDVTPCPKLWLC